MDDPAVTRNCYILIYEREDEREREFTEMDVSTDSGNDVEGEELEDNIEFVQKQEGSTSLLIGPYQVNAEDIKSLEGSNWITDQVVNSYLYMVQSCTNDTAFLDSFWVPHCIRKGVMQVRKVDNLETKRVVDPCAQTCTLGTSDCIHPRGILHCSRHTQSIWEESSHNRQALPASA